MKLGLWIKSNGMTHTDFTVAAEKIGMSISIHAVNKWCSGARIPRQKEMACIYILTGGNVSADDFYNLRLDIDKGELQNRPN